MIPTPSYVFSVPEFQERIDAVKSALGENIKLVYALKANPHLAGAAAGHADGFEACSPGEIRILEAAGIPAEHFIISGVVKEEAAMRAVVKRFGAVPLYTAESPAQMRLIDMLGAELGKKLRVLLRITSGNQFGMDKKDAEEIISKRESLQGAVVYGLHYFSGTQKRIRDTLRELKEIDAFIMELKDRFGYEAQHLEFGPGLFVTYFEGEDPAREDEELAALAEALGELRFSGTAAVELGRFLAAPCGYYVTQIADVKNNSGTVFALTDGGIHQINYYGQTMAMKVPHLLTKEAGDGNTVSVTLCGALCTAADILIRKAELPDPAAGDRIVFTRCGAYAVTEGVSLFLSRDLPSVYLYDGAFMHLCRARFETAVLNGADR